MRRIFLLPIITLFVFSITGCFGGDEEAVDESLPATSFEVHSNENFVISYPKNWKIEQGTKVPDSLKSSLVVAFVSNFKDAFFTPVITVEKITISEGVSSSKFAEQTIAANESQLVNYSEIDRKDVNAIVSDTTVLTKLVLFEGKQTIQDDTLQFVQIYLAKGTSGYIVTGAYSDGDPENESTKIVESLKSFKLK